MHHPSIPVHKGLSCLPRSSSTCPGPLSSEPKWGFLLPVVIYPASFAALKGFLLSEGHLKNWQPCEERIHFVYLCVNEQLS